MVDAPERIWALPDPATVYMDGSSPLVARDREFSRSTEYVRADIAERHLAEVQAERDALVLSTGAHITARSEYLARAEKAEAERDRLAAENERLREATRKSLDAINAVERLAGIQRGGYPRPEQEENLHLIVDQFLDLRRAALDTAKGVEK